MLGVDAMVAIRECEFQKNRVYPSVTQVNLVNRVGRDFIVKARVNGRYSTYKISGAPGRFVAKKVQLP
jgi:hypothetical protein